MSFQYVNIQDLPNPPMDSHLERALYLVHAHFVHLKPPNPDVTFILNRQYHYVALMLKIAKLEKKIEELSSKKCTEPTTTQQDKKTL